MIAAEMAIDKSAIKQSFQTLNTELALDIGPPIPREFVAAICGRLELPANIEPTAKHLLQQYDPAGGNPIGIAAAAVYVTCVQSGVNVTLKDLAAVIGLTKETIWRQKSAFTDKETS
jgi:transcription initiation factor TFIIB